MTSEWSLNNILIAYLKKLKQPKQIFLRHKPAQMEHKQRRLFWVNLEHVGGLSDVIAYNSMSNILKTEATQTKLLPAQTSTNEAQTNETIWGEFGVCGGAEWPQNDL